MITLLVCAAAQVVAVSENRQLDMAAEIRKVVTIRERAPFTGDDLKALHEARALLRRASESKDKSIVAPLKECVRRHEGTPGSGLTLEAMNALYRLDEPVAYFWDAIERREQGGVLAAIWVLGREGNAEWVDRWRRLIDGNPDLQTPAILQGLDEASLCAALMARVDGLVVTDRVDVLGSYALGSFGGNGGPETLVRERGSFPDLAPSAVWSQKELRELSLRSPRDVVNALAICKFSHITASLANVSEASLEEFRGRLRAEASAYLAETALEEWRMRAQGPR